MSNNLYRTILGAILLVSLYADIEIVTYALIAIVLFEGITNWRIPKIVNKIRKANDEFSNDLNTTRFNAESERMFRLVVGTVLVTTYPLGADSVVWFFPWFTGFAVLGAGVSGICPVLLTLKWLGFR